MLLWIAFLVVMAVWIINFRDIQDRIDAAVDSEFDAGSVGHGMWVMAVGGFLALVGILNLPSSAEPDGSSETQ